MDEYTKFFADQLKTINMINDATVGELESQKKKLSDKVECTVNAINKALGHEDPDKGGFGYSSYGYGYDSGYGRQRKAMVGYRTPKQRHRRQY